MGAPQLVDYLPPSNEVAPDRAQGDDRPPPPVDAGRSGPVGESSDGDGAPSPPGVLAVTGVQLYRRSMPTRRQLSNR